ncbi:hypothetical protein [Caballeronia sp. INDeC2]|uniref:hypothetical protein n=1 Tax=Caballeronia sp. INDeC2 TaxID=2921747 RepID=UPI0020286C1C|nr:hypothetical protein [Caballeronia sp. INDeC2]
MARRKLLFYYAWSRPGETGAPLGVIENRFPTLFESRRMAYPRFGELSDQARFDQSIAGFLDHIMKRNFAAFLELAQTQTGEPAKAIERIGDDGRATTLDSGVLDDVDTLIVISFDSLRTGQHASDAETQALRTFLSVPDHLAFVCPHHDIGEVSDALPDERPARQLEQFIHHGDKTIPPQQRFGGYAKSLLQGLGMPVQNRFGLRPALEADGSPSAIEAVRDVDRLGLLHGVGTFNAHAHLPHFERLERAVDKLDVLARQQIDPGAPPHPFARERSTFDALLQSRADAFAGTLLVGDATLWSSTAGGVESLHRLWLNVLQRPRRQ